MNIKEKKTEIILKYKLFSKLLKAKYISIHDIYSKIKITDII